MEKDKTNPNCKCPSNKCPNKGHCKLCKENHHKGLHTFCRAGRLERTARIVYARVTGN